MTVQLNPQVVTPLPSPNPGTGTPGTPERLPAEGGNPRVDPPPTSEQREQLSNATQESRDSARQAAVGVAQVNTQQQTIDTYVTVSTGSSSDDSSSGVSAADIREAQQTRAQRQVAVEFLDRAQNGELTNRNDQPLGNLVNTSV